MPYVISICNCDRKYCTAMKNRLVYGVENSYKRGHFIARIYEDACNLCGGSPRCLARCPFGAIKQPKRAAPPRVDASACFGCGVCRTVCDAGAIAMVERRKAEGAGLW